MDTSCPHDQTYTDQPGAFSQEWVVVCGLCDAHLSEPRSRREDAEADESAWHAVPLRMRVRWRTGSHGLGEFCVSKPNIDNVVVVEADYHDAVVAELTAALALAKQNAGERLTKDQRDAIDRLLWRVKAAENNSKRGDRVPA